MPSALAGQAVACRTASCLLVPLPSLSPHSAEHALRSNGVGHTCVLQNRLHRVRFVGPMNDRDAAPVRSELLWKSKVRRKVARDRVRIRGVNNFSRAKTAVGARWTRPRSPVAGERIPRIWISASRGFRRPITPGRFRTRRCLRFRMAHRAPAVRRIPQTPLGSI